MKRRLLPTKWYLTKTRLQNWHMILCPFSSLILAWPMGASNRIIFSPDVLFLNRNQRLVRCRLKVSSLIHVQGNSDLTNASNPPITPSGSCPDDTSLCYRVRKSNKIAQKLTRLYYQLIILARTTLCQITSCHMKIRSTPRFNVIKNIASGNTLTQTPEKADLDSSFLSLVMHAARLLHLSN